MPEQIDEAAAASRLMDMAIAHWAGELLLQAAEMGLADKFVGDAPRSAADIAAEYGMQPRPMRRYLRSLAGLGLFASAGGDSFRLTGLGAAMRTGAAGAARSAIIALIGDMVKPAWKVFDHGLVTGDPASSAQAPVPPRTAKAVRPLAASSAARYHASTPSQLRRLVHA